MISIILPVYGVEKYIERCFLSILNQTMCDFEVIIVDDDTKDESINIAKKIVGNDKRFKFYHKNNEGLGIARNYGLTKASGEYVVFIDSDDYIVPEYCEKMLCKIKEYDADVVYSNYFIDNNGDRTNQYCIKKETLWEHNSIKDLILDFVGTTPEFSEDTIMPISVWKAIFRKQIFEKNNIKFVSERKMISEDLIFDIDYLSKCTRIVGITDCLYAYCNNPVSLSKKYRQDRFDMEIVLYNEVKEKLKKMNYSLQEIQLRTDRFLIARARVDMFQIYKSNKSNKLIDYKYLLDNICNNKEMKLIFERYKYKEFPFKYKLILFFQKNRLYRLLLLLTLIKK